MPAYDEDLSEFARYDAQVLGVSIDTVPSIKAWAKSMGGISYPLLSDFWPHGHTALKYGVLRAEGFTERALFIVDKQGKITFIEEGNAAVDITSTADVCSRLAHKN